MKRPPLKINFPQEEEKIHQFWTDIKAFEQQLEKTKNNPEFVFYDGILLNFQITPLFPNNKENLLHKSALKKSTCIRIPNCFHRSSFCHWASALWTYFGWLDQRHRHSLSKPNGQICQSAVWLGLPRVANWYGV